MDSKVQGTFSDILFEELLYKEGMYLWKFTSESVPNYEYAIVVEERARSVKAFTDLVLDDVTYSLAKCQK